MCLILDSGSFTIRSDFSNSVFVLSSTTTSSTPESCSSDDSTIPAMLTTVVEDVARPEETDVNNYLSRVVVVE